MKISPKDSTFPITKTSYFLNFLVKICFITIKKSDDDKIKFSVVKFTFYMIGTFAVFVIGYILSQLIGMTDKVVDIYFNEVCIKSMY